LVALGGGGEDVFNAGLEGGNVALRLFAEVGGDGGNVGADLAREVREA
jgi:hypothetical protein